MKLIAVLLLVIASVHTNPLNYYGWIPGKETVFLFESQALSGIPDINKNQHAGLKLKSTVRIQSFSDYTLRIKFEEPKFDTFNGEVFLNELGKIINYEGKQEVPLPEKFAHYLETPFLVHLKNGVVETLQVTTNEPVAVTNIKKSLLAQLNLNMAPTQPNMVNSNHINWAYDEETLEEKLPFFTVPEESIHGECQTSYNIHPLPAWKAKELEEFWALEEQKLKPESEMKQPPKLLPGKFQCEGKRYYKIVKTRDFDKCKVRPMFQKWTGIEGVCDVSKTSTCEPIFTHLSTTTYYVCGELSEFYIRKISAVGAIRSNPVGWNTQEKDQTTSHVFLELLKIKPITERLPIPSGTKELKSLIYTYPYQKPGMIDEEIVKETEELFGFYPVLPQPGLTEAPMTLYAEKVPKESIKSQIVEEINMIAHKVFESPESCSSKEDIAGTLTTTIRYMRLLSLPELKELEQKIVRGTPGPSHELKPVQKLFYDTLAMVGTNPSTMLIIEKVKTRSLPEHVLHRMLQYGIRNVRYPTKSIMKELVELVKTGPILENKKFFSVALPELSSLFYRAYIQPSTMLSNFPTRIYGIFGTKETPVLTENYIPFLLEKVQQPQNEHLRLVVISSLGKLGHLKTFKTLLRVVEGQYTKEPMFRSLALYSMKRLTKMHPAEVKPILLAIIENPVEYPEIKIAAISILPWAKPTMVELQKLSVLTWYEPIKQVKAFIVSTLKSLVTTQVPELKKVGIKAKSVLPFLKPEYHGLQYSHNSHFGTFIEYLKTGVSQKFSTVWAKDYLFPVKTSMKTEYIRPFSSFKLKGLSYTVYTQGMERLMNEYLKFFGESVEASTPVKEYLQKIVQTLNLKTHELPIPKIYFQESIVGIESHYLLEYNTLTEYMEKALKQTETNFQYKIISATQVFETFDIFITENGLPLIREFTYPAIYAAKGFVEYKKNEGKLIPSIKASMIPVMNAKVQTTIAFVFPFTEKLLGTGVEMSLHTSLPLEAEFKVKTGEVEVTLKNPTEIIKSPRETETFHAFVYPYTIKTELWTVKPISKSTSLKTILTGKPKKEAEFPIGTKMGLSANLKFQTDAEFYDLYSYIEKIRQTSPLTFPKIFALPSSLKLSSTKIQYHPSQSQTKEIVFNFKLYIKERDVNHPLRNWSYSPYGDRYLENNGFRSEAEILRKSDSATVLEMTATRKGRDGEDHIKSAFVVGKTNEDPDNREIRTKSYAAFNIRIPSGPAYIFKFEGYVNEPIIKNRFNLESLLNEQPKLELSGKMTYGLENSPKVIKTDFKFTKTEELKEEIRSSPEYKKCIKEKSVLNRWLSPICQVALTQASYLNNLEIELEMPPYYYKHPVVQQIGEIIKSMFVFHIEPTTGGPTQIEGGQTTKLEVKIDRTSTVAKARAFMPSGYQYKFHNIRVLGYTKHLFPLPLLKGFPTVFIQKFGQYQLPPTCTIEPRFITTFDNKTYEYVVNDCEHLVFMDRSKKFPLAVLTKSMESEQKKQVKILSGLAKVELTPLSGRELKVIANGQTLNLQPGQIKYWKKEGEIYLELKRYYDNVYLIYAPKQSLTVLTDGTRIEVTSPFFLKGVGAGLCGDLNGEKVADLKTPNMCIMNKPQLSAVSFILNKEGHSNTFPTCSGIPSQYREEYMKEKQNCTLETFYPTPLIPLYHHKRSMAIPHLAHHLVEKQRDQLCISKQIVRVCSDNPPYPDSDNDYNPYMNNPLQMKSKTVEYVCYPRYSDQAQYLEQKAKSGETLNVELMDQPVAYRKVEFEPHTCAKLVNDDKPYPTRRSSENDSWW